MIPERYKHLFNNTAFSPSSEIEEFLGEFKFKSTAHNPYNDGWMHCLIFSLINSRSLFRVSIDGWKSGHRGEETLRDAIGYYIMRNIFKQLVQNGLLEKINRQPIKVKDLL